MGHRSPVQHRPERIRLNGIDCPEKAQAYGKQAKQAASELVFGKRVTLKTYGLDKYGGTVAARCSHRTGVVRHVVIWRQGGATCGNS